MKKRSLLLILLIVVMLTVITFTTGSTIAYAEEEPMVYKIDEATAQSNFTTEAQTELVFSVTVRYDKDLPEDFADVGKYEDMKLSATDFEFISNGPVCTIKKLEVRKVGIRDVVYDLTLSIGKTDGSFQIKCSKAFIIRQVTVVPKTTIFDGIINILKTQSIIVLIITAAFTIIGKSAIKIFRFGVNYKSTFATVEQQEKFEQSVRDEMRAEKMDMQENLLKTCLREIQRETRPIRDLQSLASSIQTDREILNVRLDSLDQKYAENRQMRDDINRLQQQVSRMQYSDGTSEVRRTGK